MTKRCVLFKTYLLRSTMSMAKMSQFWLRGVRTCPYGANVIEIGRTCRPRSNCNSLAKECARTMAARRDTESSLSLTNKTAIAWCSHHAGPEGYFDTATLKLARDRGP